MDKINLIINKRLNQHKIGDTARAAEILHKANIFFQKKLSCSTDEVKAFRLKEGVLYVGTAGSAWSQEVFHHCEGLMEEIRRDYGQKAILRVLIKGLTSDPSLG